MTALALRAFSFLGKVRTIGYSSAMDDYETRKLAVFNQLNALGIVSGIAVSLAGMFDDQDLPLIASFVALSPTIVSTIVMVLNYYKKYEWARMFYFSLYPVLTASVYGAGLDVGIELFFVLYALLAVFYLQKPLNHYFSELHSIFLHA